MGMPEAVVTAGRILHELDEWWRVGSLIHGQYRVGNIAVQGNERPPRQGIPHTPTLSRVSLESLDAIGAAPPAQRVAPPERERANKAGLLVVDPRLGVRRRAQRKI